MKIARVHIENYRSIKQLDFSPNNYCALIGENNAGKSNILKAINLVLGETWPTDRTFTEEDFNDYNTENDIVIQIYFDSTIDEWRNNCKCEIAGFELRGKAYKRRVKSKPAGTLVVDFVCIDKKGRMKEEIERGRVVFGQDETTTPRIRTNLFESDKEVMRSVHFSYAQTASQTFNAIFENRRVFENPKSIDDIKNLVEYVTAKDDGDIILDFFSGSATTAHAVMQLNAEDGGNRRFIMVQLPEVCDEKSEAAKAGYKNICEIGKERIRRAGKKLQEFIRESGYGYRKLMKDGKPYTMAVRRKDDTSGDSEYIMNPEIITGKDTGLYDTPINLEQLQSCLM